MRIFFLLFTLFLWACSEKPVFRKFVASSSCMTSSAEVDFLENDFCQSQGCYGDILGIEFKDKINDDHCSYFVTCMRSKGGPCRR